MINSVETTLRNLEALVSISGMFKNTLHVWQHPKSGYYHIKNSEGYFLVDELYNGTIRFIPSMFNVWSSITKESAETLLLRISY